MFNIVIYDSIPVPSIQYLLSPYMETNLIKIHYNYKIISEFHTFYNNKKYTEQQFIKYIFFIHMNTANFYGNIAKNLIFQSPRYAL